MQMHFRRKDVKQCHAARKKTSRCCLASAHASLLAVRVRHVDYQAFPARLLSALKIHCRLFASVLHVFYDV